MTEIDPSQLDLLTRGAVAVDAGYTALNHPTWMILHSEPEFQQMKAEVDAHLEVMHQRVAALAEEQGPVSAFPEESGNDRS